MPRLRCCRSSPRSTGTWLGLPRPAAPTAGVTVACRGDVLELRAGGGLAVLPLRLPRPGRPLRRGARVGCASTSSSCPIRETGEAVFDFTNWDAKAVYFHDPAGQHRRADRAPRGRRGGRHRRLRAVRAARPLRDRARLRSAVARRRARARARARGLGRHRRGRGAARLRRREGANADPLPGRAALAPDGPARRGASGRGHARPAPRRASCLWTTGAACL